MRIMTELIVGVLKNRFPTIKVRVSADDIYVNGKFDSIIIGISTNHPKVRRPVTPITLKIGDDNIIFSTWKGDKYVVSHIPYEDIANPANDPLIVINKLIQPIEEHWAPDSRGGGGGNTGKSGGETDSSRD